MKRLEKKIGGKNVAFKKFGGIDEMVTYIEHTPKDDGFDDTFDGSREVYKDFYGADSYAEAREYIKKGVNIKDIMVAINTGNREYNKKQMVRHVCGGAPCVAAAAANSPRAMYQKRNEQITGAYDIFINCGCNCNVTPQEFKDAGIEILKEVLRISAIKPVNLYVGATAIDFQSRNIVGYGMQVMDAGKSFNAARVSYALTEAGFFRVFGFALYARTEGVWSPDNNWCLGRALSVHNADLNKKVLSAAYKNMLYVNITDVIEGRRGALKELEVIK